MNLALVRLSFVVGIIMLVIDGMIAFNQYTAQEFSPLSGALALIGTVLFASVVAYLVEGDLWYEKLVAVITGLNVIVLAGYGLWLVPWADFITYGFQHPIFSMIMACGASLLAAALIHEIQNRGIYGRPVRTVR